MMSTLRQVVQNAGWLMTTPEAWLAAVSWPCFSLTSYRLVTRLLGQGITPRTVIDVGANVGQFAVAAAKLLPSASVHSFEPAPAAFDQLRKNVAGLRKVRLYPLAVGDKDGQTTFHVNIHSHSSSVRRVGKGHLEAFPAAQEAEIIVVDIARLDTALAEAELAAPTLLKLDVQGYETQALRGARQTLDRVNAAVIEVSFKPLYEGEETFAEVLRLMAEREFRFDRPVGLLLEPRTDEILQLDALFLRTDDVKEPQAATSAG